MFLFLLMWQLHLLTPTPLSAKPQNGQTHSNYSLATADCLSMFNHFAELVLKGLMPRTSSFSMCVAMFLLFMQVLFRNRSSPPELFLGKDVLKISSKFRGEHLFVVYAKFLKAVQSFECQYNVLLLCFTYVDPAFFIG